MLPVALIPAYKPSECLVGIVRDLIMSSNFSAIVCVDDGSGKDFVSLFDQLEKYGATILRHATNLGKGCALKTGFNYVAVKYPDSHGIVTLDADGQHLVKDCISVSKALVKNNMDLILGVRKFDNKDVPARSKIGNTVTRYVMRFFSGINIADTQTGLRGIPLNLCIKLLKIKSNGYDFELDMLMSACENKISIFQVPIETMYIDNNASSHFNPFWDSLKIYMVFLRFNISAILTFMIDYAVFGLVYAASSSVISSIVIARFFAGIFNYRVNKEIVFRSHKKHAEAIFLYALTVFVMGSLAYMCINLLATRFDFNVYVAKVFVELVLFCFSFIVQRDFVFSQREDMQKTETNWGDYYKSRSMFSIFTSNIAFRSFLVDINKYLPRVDSFLELGGANSIFFDSLCKNFPEAQLIFVDRCQCNAEFESKISNKSVKCEQCDILDCELEEYRGKIDCVFSFGLIEHFDVSDTAKIIKRHFDLVREDGLVYISFPTPTILYKCVRFFLEVINKWVFHDERPLKFSEVLDTVSECGEVLDMKVNHRLGLSQGIVIARKRDRK